MSDNHTQNVVTNMRLHLRNDQRERVLAEFKFLAQLGVNNIMREMNPDRYCRHHLAAKEHRELIRKLKASIDADGMVNVEEHGRDCDCVQYAGRMHRIQPTVAAYHALEADIAEWCDGIFGLTIVDPETAKNIRYNSRDLIAEAHENGHPWVVYP